MAVARLSLGKVEMLCVVGVVMLRDGELGIIRNRVIYCGFRILDREYVTLPTANHYVNTNQLSSRTNSAAVFVSGSRIRDSSNRQPLRQVL